MLVGLFRFLVGDDLFLGMWLCWCFWVGSSLVVWYCVLFVVLFIGLVLLIGLICLLLGWVILVVLGIWCWVVYCYVGLICCGSVVVILGGWLVGRLLLWLLMLRYCGWLLLRRLCGWWCWCWRIGCCCCFWFGIILLVGCCLMFCGVFWFGWWSSFLVVCVFVVFVIRWMVVCWCGLLCCWYGW